MPKKNKRVLITGASSGIGKAMALSMADLGHELFLVARREEKLKILETEIRDSGAKSKIHLLAADINGPQFLEQMSLFCGEDIDILINNAGLALGKDSVLHSQLEDWDIMIQTNISSHFKIARTVLPWMLKNGEGDMINLCSVAGHYTYAGGAVYCATKHAVKAFTRVLREETCGQNIRVMQISPGMVETEFSQVRFRGNHQEASRVYEAMKPLDAEDVARMMTFMLQQPRHVVIDEIITMPSDQGSPTTVSRNKNDE